MKERQPGWFDQNGLLTKVVDVAGKYLERRTAGMVGWWFYKHGFQTIEGDERSRKILR